MKPFIKDITSANKAGNVFEFGGSKSLDIAFAELKGNYPEKGWAMNEKSDMVYIVKTGEAKIYFNRNENENYSIKEGNVVFIPKKTEYKLEVASKDALQIWVPSSPKWSLKQYKIK